MRRHREHRIRDSGIPWNAGVTRDMGSAVDVPKATEVVIVARRLPPGGIGNDVAILPQQGFNDLEDPRMGDGALDRAAPIEHLVSKRGRLLGCVASVIGRVLVENPIDVGAEGSDLTRVEYPFEHDEPVRLEALRRRGGRVGAERQESGRPSEHSPILPPTGCRGQRGVGAEEG